MPRHCSATGCRSRDNREARSAGVTFHRLPKKGNPRRTAWITNARRKGPGGKGLWEPQSDYIYFCSKHFTLDSFELSGVSGYRRLKDDAVPVMVEIPSAQKSKSSRGRSKTQSGDKHLSSPSSPDKDLSDCKESLINIALGHIVEDEEAESIKSATEDHKNESSPPSPLLLQTPAPDHPTDQPTKIPSAPPSPSRYMRRLPPPPGFYLAKEHSYAQLCPLEWRKRYEKATDNLEKALRLLRAARRRENRLRLTLLRLQDTRLKQTLSQIPDRRKDGQDSHNRSEPRQSAKPARSGQNSGLEEVEEAETEGTGEEMELLTDESWRKEPSAKLKDGVEDEDGCCFYCGRGREDEDAKETGSPRSRTVQARRGRGRNVFRETMAESKSHLKAPVCQNMDPEQLNEMLLQIHPHSTATFQELTTSSPHLQHLQLLQPDLSLLHGDMSSTDVSFTQGEDGGGGMCHVFLVPVSSESKEMSRMGVDGSIQKTQSILMAEETFQEVIGEQGVDMGLRQSGLSANQSVQQTNATSRMVSGDVTQRLKEHLEGFQLQLSSEFID
ncbi:THAP domain-containing protein 7 [Silurus asotus]|uniref:THAP domain-containing protein 7 n=1 Tax=Silurus asotus TaxID=30991 RepID=A0AAD5FI03_SILAS|nr:THAP domain-containing protein 7 [Silurus asotus]